MDTTNWRILNEKITLRMKDAGFINIEGVKNKIKVSYTFNGRTKSFISAIDDLEDDDDDMDFTPKVIVKLIKIMPENIFDDYWSGTNTYFLEFLINLYLNPNSNLVDFFREFKDDTRFEILEGQIKIKGEIISLFSTGQDAGELYCRLLNKELA